MVRISTSALQRIELGSLKLSSRVAWRIRSVTDVDVQSLTRPRQTIRHASGEEYTRKHFERCQQRFQSLAMDQERQYMTEELCDRISILLGAAPRRQFPLVASDVWSAIDKLRKTYGLAQRTKELLRNNSRKPREEWASIAPPGKVVFFDDKGYQLFSMSDNVGLLTSRLSIGRESLAYGLTNDGVIIEIRRAVSNSNRDAGKKQLFTPPSLAARLRRRRSSATRKPKA